jgi:hypothetical protein
VLSGLIGTEAVILIGKLALADGVAGESEGGEMMGGCGS